MAKMKILKVAIRRGDYRAGEHKMKYPDVYNPQEVDAIGIGPQAIGIYEGGIGMGRDTDYCFIALPEKTADRYLTDPDIEEHTPEQADAELEKWRIKRGIPETVVNDVGRLALINLKVTMMTCEHIKDSPSLSQEDIDAIDPAKPTPGVRRLIRPVAEILAEYE
jgi:hypothetical protein